MMVVPMEIAGSMVVIMLIEESMTFSSESIHDFAHIFNVARLSKC